MALLRRVSLLLCILQSVHTVQAQTCYDTIKKVAPNGRYDLQAGGTEVYDKITQLTWKRCPEGLSGINCTEGEVGTYAWSEALSRADGIWRLPNIKELNSLVETACSYPAINLVAFPNTSGASFWSSSRFDLSTSAASSYRPNAWYIGFGEGESFQSHWTGFEKSDNLYVRLVRGE